MWGIRLGMKEVESGLQLELKKDLVRTQLALSSEP